MSTLAPVWLADRRLARVFDALGAPAVDVRVVGSAVRDALLKRDHADSEIDIGTPETPDAVQHRLAAAKIRCLPTGLAHGTVMAIVDGRSFEITSLRRDTACDGRHADVAFTTDWHEDARRRDFTINAMSLTPAGVLADDHGGANDAEAGRLRFVGDPTDRIREDYLRILRLFRFAAWYGREPIDAAILAACSTLKGGLRHLSAERVHDELAKLLAAPDPSTAVAAMAGCGVLAAVLPGARAVSVLARLVDAERSAVPGDWLVRLTVLIEPVAAEQVAAVLKMSHAERSRLMALSAPLPLIAPLSDARTVRQALYDLGSNLVLDRVMIALATGPMTDVATWLPLIATVRAWTHRPLPVSGDDVLARGVAAGPAVGRLLTAMTAWWIDRAFTPSRDEALAWLSQLVTESRKQ